MARVSEVFMPKDREFFDLFEEAGTNILRAADLLDQMLRGYPENAGLARDILICEQEGDRITHDIIHRLENEGDRLLRDAMRSLFANGIDPMVVIRWKDIFERLEDAIDATEKTANILEGIVIKNA